MCIGKVELRTEMKKFQENAKFPEHYSNLTKISFSRRTTKHIRFLEKYFFQVNLEAVSVFANIFHVIFHILKL